MSDVLERLDAYLIKLREEIVQKWDDSDHVAGLEEAERLLLILFPELPQEINMDEIQPHNNYWAFYADARDLGKSDNEAHQYAKHMVRPQPTRPDLPALIKK